MAARNRTIDDLVGGLPFPSLPCGPFGAIACDSPWNFVTWNGAQSVPQLDDLKRLPVASVAAPDCVLFAWIVDSHFDQGLSLARHWGFEYKTIAFVWDKGRIGMGHWTRKQAELCLLFTRGKPKRLSKGVQQIIRAPRREHSRKPDEQYTRIEQLVAGPYLELFARQQWPGWTAWGDQANVFTPEKQTWKNSVRELIDNGECLEITLNNGAIALVDYEDRRIVEGLNWTAKPSSGDIYATNGGRPLHQILLGANGGDHRDGNTLNNRRYNLRPATSAQNNRNRRLASNNTTGFKGVSFRADRGTYLAAIRLGPSLKKIGTYPTPEQAARAYDDVARDVFGEFAALNFPLPGERGALSKAPEIFEDIRELVG
jgi:N6-adenosine-specific RNA methylase IME4